MLCGLLGLWVEREGGRGEGNREKIIMLFGVSHSRFLFFFCKKIDFFWFFLVGNLCALVYYLFANIFCFLLQKD